MITTTADLDGEMVTHVSAPDYCEPLGFIGVSAHGTKLTMFGSPDDYRRLAAAALMLADELETARAAYWIATSAPGAPGTGVPPPKGVEVANARGNDAAVPAGAERPAGPSESGGNSAVDPVAPPAGLGAAGIHEVAP